MTLEWSKTADGDEKIDGRYQRFKTCILKGSFKNVYEAFDTKIQKDVAWNIVDLSEVRSESELENLKKETNILKALTHENIIRIHNTWISKNRNELVFITDRMRDSSLLQYIMKRDITLGRVKEFCRQILSALHYLHFGFGVSQQPIIHRDLKCDNIFIDAAMNKIVIGNLGLALIDTSKSKGHSLVGTAEFMAPEMYQEKYDEKVDIYAFGMCVLQMVTKKYPYGECQTLHQVYKKVTSRTLPEALKSVVSRSVKEFIIACCEFKPEKRPSAKDLLGHPFMVYDYPSNKYSCSDYRVLQKTIDNEAELHENQTVYNTNSNSLLSPPQQRSTIEQIDKFTESNPLSKHSLSNSADFGRLHRKVSTEGSDDEKFRHSPSSLDLPLTKSGLFKKAHIVKAEKTESGYFKIVLNVHCEMKSHLDSRSNLKMKSVSFDYDPGVDTPQSVAWEMVCDLGLEPKDKMQLAIEEALSLEYINEELLSNPSSTVNPEHEQQSRGSPVVMVINPEHEQHSMGSPVVTVINPEHEQHSPGSPVISDDSDIGGDDLISMPDLIWNEQSSILNQTNNARKTFSNKIDDGKLKIDTKVLPSYAENRKPLEGSKLSVEPKDYFSGNEDTDKTLNLWGGPNYLSSFPDDFRPSQIYNIPPISGRCAMTLEEHLDMPRNSTISFDDWNPRSPTVSESPPPIDLSPCTTPVLTPQNALKTHMFPSSRNRSGTPIRNSLSKAKLLCPHSDHKRTHSEGRIRDHKAFELDQLFPKHNRVVTDSKTPDGFVTGPAPIEGPYDLNLPLNSSSKKLGSDKLSKDISSYFNEPKPLAENCQVFTKHMDNSNRLSSSKSTSFKQYERKNNTKEKVKRSRADQDKAKKMSKSKKWEQIRQKILEEQKKLCDDSLVGKDAIKKPKAVNNSPSSDSALRSVSHNIFTNSGTITDQTKTDIEQINIREVFALPNIKRWQSYDRKNQIARINTDGAFPRSKTTSINRKLQGQAGKVGEEIPNAGRDRMNDQLWQSFDNKQEDSVDLIPELELHKSLSSPLASTSAKFLAQNDRTEVKDIELWTEFNSKIEHHLKAINKKLVYNCRKVMDEYRQRLDEIDEFMEMWYSKEKDKARDATLKLIIDYQLKDFRVQFERMKKESNDFESYSGLKIPSYISRKV